MDFIFEKQELLNRIENGMKYKDLVNLFDAWVLEVMLVESRGNQTEAAELLGMDRGTLRRKAKASKVNVKK